MFVSPFYYCHLKVFIPGMFKLSLNILSVSQLVILEGRIKHCDYFRSG